MTNPTPTRLTSKIKVWWNSELSLGQTIALVLALIVIIGGINLLLWNTIGIAAAELIWIPIVIFLAFYSGRIVERIHQGKLREKDHGESVSS